MRKNLGRRRIGSDEQNLCNNWTIQGCENRSEVKIDGAGGIDRFGHMDVKEMERKRAALA